MKIAVFPGQGAQHVGMGKELCDNFRIAREIFEEASDSTHLNLKKICFEGPESDLTLTEYTQPSLLTCSVAAYRVAHAETGFTPSAVAGHSLGEYSALVAIGALPLSSTAKWVHERGKAMQLAVPSGQGTMAAIMGLNDDTITKLCSNATSNAQEQRRKGAFPDLTVDPIAEPANFNAPGQVVIAGSTDAVQEAIALVKSGGDFGGGKAVPLQVSAPFHCRLMAPARARMAELFSNASKAEHPKLSNIPYVPNRTARPTNESGLVFELLVEQVNSPVLWRQSITALLELPLTSGTPEYTAIEFGPGKVLTGLIKRIAQPLGKTCRLQNVPDLAGIKALAALTEADSRGTGNKETST